MCAITGAIGLDASWVGEALRKMSRRGPDASALLPIRGTRLVLGHNRLSIIDVDPRSNQPFISRCEQFAIVFNGEIYNYRELRSELQLEGVVFSTSSDTEVLLYWLMRRGAPGIRLLRGMFAFCFVDLCARTAIMARDHIGEKPLYYAVDKRAGSIIAFASEIAPLFRAPDACLDLSREALFEYLRFLYAPAPSTFFVGIKELQPGYYTRFDAVSGEILQAVSYYDLEEDIQALALTAREVSPLELMDQFADLFKKAVGQMAISDAGLGIFLSGGVDSNAIACSLSGARNDVFARVLSYAGNDDETSLAKAAAAVYGFPIDSVSTTETSLAQDLEKIVMWFGQPFGNMTALSTFAVASSASDRAKVCLSGDGGDEVLVGYPRHRAARYAAQVPRSFRPLFAYAARAQRSVAQFFKGNVSFWRMHDFLDGFGTSGSDPYIEWMTYTSNLEASALLGQRMESRFDKSLGEIFNRNRDSPLRAASLVDLRSFVPFNLLQCTDRAGMAASVEVRCPFLHLDVVRCALAFPDELRLQSGKVKPLVTANKNIPFPTFLAKQKKRPFNPPMRSRFHREREHIARLLCGEDSALRGTLDLDVIGAIIDECSNVGRVNETLLWGLLVLERWLSRRPWS